MAWWRFPPLQPPSLTGLGFLRWGIVAADEPHVLSSQSPPPLYWLRDGGPPASSWAGPPIRARGQGTSWPLGQLVEINSNILPLISSYTFTFISFTPFIFHHRLMHRTVSSSQSVADRFNSYNTCLCSEIDSLTLGPFIVRKT